MEQRGLSDFLGQEKQCRKWRAVEFPEPQELKLMNKTMTLFNSLTISEKSLGVVKEDD